MKILSWNIEEGAEKGFENQMRDLFKTYIPDIVILILMENNLNSSRCQLIIQNLKTSNYVEVLPEGFLWLFLKHEMNSNLKLYAQVIDLYIAAKIN